MPQLPSRKECRRAVKKTLKKLHPGQSLRDDVTHRWMISRCARCGACAKFLSGLGVAPMAPVLRE